jgi:GT2 family glycosyltransferase
MEVSPTSSAGTAPARTTVPSGGMLAVELTEPLPAVTAERLCSAPEHLLSVLVRLHGHPVGQLNLGPPADGLTPAEFASAIWEAVPAIKDHLRADGFAVPTDLGVAGIEPANGTAPRCLIRRREVLRDPPLITVLIATRNRPESLLRCLQSVARLEYPRFEVLVVDSAPTSDASRRALEQLGGRVGPAALRYLHEPVPGLALAHNRGLRVAHGSWLAITDDDVIVDRQWLAAIAESSTLDRSVACVTGLIMPAELVTPAQVLLEQYGGFARGFSPKLYDTGAHRPDDPLFPLAAGRLGSGANMAFRTDVLRELGGFEAAMGAGTPARGGDDLAAFLRLLRAGHGLAYQPSAIVWHHHRREYQGLQRQARHYGVGLGAYLTNAVVRDPRLGLTMLRKALPAMRHLLDPTSPKNSSKRPDFPRELERAERIGLMLGPVAYASSRLRYRGVR